jgi:predicted phage tail protein
MRASPTTNRDRFSLLRFVLKAYMIVVLVFFFVWTRAELATPIAIGYFVAGLSLLTIAVVEMLRRRRESAISDFVFAALAFVLSWAFWPVLRI